MNSEALPVAQLPETAEHRDMPEAAIKTGNVNLIVPAEQMYDDIVQFINTRAIASTVSKKAPVDAIFELLEKRSGTDFSMYKPTTIMRRIDHRITFLQLGTMLEYYEFIKSNPRELDNLFDAVLIGVTEFFRDLEAFDLLRAQITQMIEDKEPGDSIRIWSVGCATGEEPYSIAILLYEILGSKIDQFHIQIFATDIDERAINFGRKGIFNKDNLANVPKKVLNEFFSKTDNLHYEVKKEIKQHILFERHDITTDPPFVKLDLVTCRNLLIYFNNTLQKQTFQIFHYSLKPQGLLFLGKSESVSVAADLFNKLNKGKLFRKADNALSYQLKFSRFKQRSQELKKDEVKNNIRNMTIADVAKETLYHKYEHPFVIINESSEIKEVHGSLRLYLEIGQGTMNFDLHKMVNKELVTVVKATLAQVKKTNVSHTSHIVKFKLYEQLHYVRIKITPLVYRINDLQFFIVVFEKIEPSEGHIELQKKLETKDFVNLRIKELEDELTSTKEHLQIFTEELEATNEELQTINEELQSSNEELKSSNEEMETSNEELQSANEELNTANQELRLTNDFLIEKEKELQEEKELSQHNELIYKTIAENIPDASVGILNKDLEIEYLTGSGNDEIDVNDVIGKYMPSINPSKKEAKRIEKLCRKTLEGQPGSMEVKYNNRYYQIKTVLLKLPQESEEKILYLAQEITAIKQNQIMLETAITASNLIVLEHDFDNRILQPNEKINKLLEFKLDRKLTVDDVISKIHPDDILKGEDSIKKALKTGFISYELRLQLKNSIKYIRVNGRLIKDDKKKPKKVFATILDITHDKTLLQQVQESEERFRVLADNTPITIWRSDKYHNCIYVNKTWLENTGSQLEDNLGQGWLKYIHPDDKDLAWKSYKEAYDNLDTLSVEYRLKKFDGSYIWLLNTGVPYYDANNNFDGYIGSNVNITEQKKFTSELEQKVKVRTKDITKANNELIKLNMNLEEFAYMASHDLKEPLRKIRTFNSIIVSEKAQPESISTYCSKIEQSAERMTDLIDNIMEYSRIDENSVKPEPMVLDETLDEVLSDLSILLENQNVEINRGDLGGINGIPIRIYQLFSNLIKNGIKFNTKVPVIDISTFDIKGFEVPKRFEANQKRDYKKIVFRDNGIGLDERKKDYIFKPFKRLNSSSDYKGTGIGLAICKRIMELHEGYIDVKSKMGEGSSFILYFPV